MFNQKCRTCCNYLYFMPGTLTRFVNGANRENWRYETVPRRAFREEPIELDIPRSSITGHELRALSARIEDALAKGASMPVGDSRDGARERAA